MALPPCAHYGHARSRGPAAHLAWLALSAAVAFPDASQAQARQAEPDTTRPVTILSEVFSSASVSQFAYAVLAAGTAYRVEVEPARASVSFRYARSPSQPPLVLQSMENPAQSAGGVSYLLIPRETAEYRVDVAPFDEPVRLRIVRDPREQALLQRARSAPRTGYGALLVRGVTHSGDVLVDGPVDSAGVLTGAEACLLVPPGAIRRARALGGCLLRVGLLSHGNGSLLLFGIAPRFQVYSGGAHAVALSADYAFGESSSKVAYSAWGIGVVLTADLGRRLTLEIEPGYAVYSHRLSAFTTEQVRNATGRVAAGLRLNL